MQHDTGGLETFARDAASKGAAYWVELIDLSALPLDNDESLVEAVSDVLREYVSRAITRFFRLTDHRIVIVTDIGHGREIDRGLRALAADLRARHDGAIAATPYQLPRDIEDFLAFCGNELKRVSEAETAMESRNDATKTFGRRFSEAMRAARSLVHADLSAYVHEIAVIDLQTRNGETCATELTPSLSEVARALHVPVDTDDWLARHLAGLIHGRVLQQVRDEPWRTRSPLHLNALPETVLSSAFDAFLRDIDPVARDRITIEMPAETAIQEPETFDQARQALASNGFHLGLDHVAPDMLPDLQNRLNQARVIKVTGGESALEKHGDKLRHMIKTHDKPFWVLLDAPSAPIRSAALALGFKGAQERSGG